MLAEDALRQFSWSAGNHQQIRAGYSVCSYGLHWFARTSNPTTKSVVLQILIVEM